MYNQVRAQACFDYARAPDGAPYAAHECALARQQCSLARGAMKKTTGVSSMEAAAAGTTTETGIDEKQRSFTSLRSKAMARRPAGIALPMPAANTAAATSSATTPCTVPHPITSLRPPPLTENKQVKTWLVKMDRMKKGHWEHRR